MEKSGMIKKCMNDGLIFGVILVILNVLIYVLIDFETLSFWSIMSFALLSAFLPLVVGIIVFLVKYKKNDLGGFISYGNGLKYGTLLTLFASIILSFYTIVFNNFIDKEYAHKQQQIIMSKTYEFMESSGLPDKVIDEKMDEMEAAIEAEVQNSKFMSPIKSIFFLTFVGFIISLIVAAIVKKEPQPEF